MAVVLVSVLTRRQTCQINRRQVHRHERITLADAFIPNVTNVSIRLMSEFIIFFAIQYKI